MISKSQNEKIYFLGTYIINSNVIILIVDFFFFNMYVIAAAWLWQVKFLTQLLESLLSWRLQFKPCSNTPACQVTPKTLIAGSGMFGVEDPDIISWKWMKFSRNGQAMLVLILSATSISRVLHCQPCPEWNLTGPNEMSSSLHITVY